MQCGFKAAYDCIKAFSEKDTSEDLRGADVPILVLISFLTDSLCGWRDGYERT